jgi:hypothetical protein
MYNILHVSYFLRTHRDDFCGKRLAISTLNIFAYISLLPQLYAGLIVIDNNRSSLSNVDVIDQ